MRKLKKRKLALDAALQRKLYKLGVSYGTELKKIYGQDDVYNAVLTPPPPIKAFAGPAWVKNKEGYMEHLFKPMAEPKNTKSYEDLMYALNHRGDFNRATAAASTIQNTVKSAGQKVANRGTAVASTIQNAVKSAGQKVANIGNSASGLAGNISPKLSELMRNYPKTTGLAVAAGIAAALGGLGYGAYKLFNGGNNDKKNPKKKSSR